MNYKLDAIKATEVAFQIISREGGELDKLKLIKLMYLLDREAINQRGVPIVGGNYKSFFWGPVISDVLDLINHRNNSGWNTAISPLIGPPDKEWNIKAVADPGRDHLSDRELNLLNSVWEKFGHMTGKELSSWTHEHVTEWEELKSGSKPIEIEEIGRALHFSEGSIQALTEQAASAKLLDDIFAC